MRKSAPILLLSFALFAVVTTPARAEAVNSALQAQGNAAPQLTLQVGGSDGTNLRTIQTDASGRQIAVGAAGEGAARVGNAVPVAGKGFNGVVFEPPLCDKALQVNLSAVTANQQLIAPVAGQNIYVCGFQFAASVATTATTIQFKEGTGTVCGTGTANSGPPAFTMPTAAPTSANFSSLSIVNPGVAYTATAGDALCLVFGSVANGITVAGTVWYTQK